MFNSPILDVAFGLMFSFLTISLAAGTIYEAVASVAKLRSKTLLSGIRTLVNDSTASGLVLELYKHAAISPRDSGTATAVGDLKNKPAYIDPKQFANAFLDIINVSASAPGPASVTAMLAALDAKIPATPPAGGAPAGVYPDAQLNMLLKGIINRAQGDFEKMQTEVGSWFDNGMDRLSGTYKRWSQLFTFLFACVIAGLCNIDSISIAERLWEQPTLISSLKADKAPDTTHALDDLTKYLPVGWTQDAASAWTKGSPVFVPRTSAAWLMLAGWLLSGLSALFGAPFWFDTLQQVARLKGSGPSPAEKKSGDSAAA